MAEIYIHYGNLEDSINQSKKVRNEISEYISEIRKRVTNPIGSLPGSDSAGYASTASSLAMQKISDLSAKASRYVAYESSVSTLISTAKTKDNYVSGQMEAISDMYLAERNWFQRAGDALYNLFCVDIPNKWGWTRTISDVSKWVRDKVNNVTDKIRDWFKYGDGKYIANIGKAVLGAVLAVAGVIVAIASLPAVGTAAFVIACVSLVAATVSMVITLFNSEATILSNLKAWQLRDEHPGAARYYGNIDSLSDKWKKTDMGDAETNKRYDVAGKVIDTTKVVADTTQFVCNILKLGVVRDFRFTQDTVKKNAKALDFSFENIKRNILHDMGVYTSKVGKEGVKWHETINWKKAFKPKAWVEGYSEGQFKLGGKGALLIPEKLYQFFNITKIVNNTNNTVDAFFDIKEALNEEDFKLGDLLKPLGKLTTVFKPVANPVKYITDTSKTFDSFGTWIKDIFSGSPVSDNPEPLSKEEIQSWFDEIGFGPETDPESASAALGTLAGESLASGVVTAGTPIGTQNNHPLIESLGGVAEDVINATTPIGTQNNHPPIEPLTGIADALGEIAGQADSGPIPIIHTHRVVTAT